MGEKLPPRAGGVLSQTWGYTRHPVRHFVAAAERCGDPFIMPMMFGTMFVTGRPEAFRAVFGADPSVFDAFMGDVLEPFAGRHSLVVMHGAPHKAERKLLTPFFHGERLRGYGERIRAIVLRHASAWKPDQNLVLHDELLAMAMDIIVDVIFGVREPERVLEFRNAVIARDHAMSPFLVFFKPLQKIGGIGPWARFQRAAKKLDELFLVELTARRKDGERRDDVLDSMLQARYDDGSGMSDRAICDELITMAVAGHETAAITMAWALYWIHQHADVRAQLDAELAALGPEPPPEQVAKLPFLDAVVNETMRLTHPGTDIMRRLKEPFELLGFQLPAGMGIDLCIPLLHFREELYPEPREFRPRRFLERTFAPYEFAPWGGGNRRCLGAGFALYEMKIVLATLFGAFKWEPLWKKPLAQKRWNVFLAPEGGVKMRFGGAR